MIDHLPRVTVREARERRLNTAFLVLAVVVLSCACLSASFVAGRSYQAYVHSMSIRIPAPRPAALPRPALIPCTDEGKAEHNRICSARARIAKVGPK